MFCTLIQKSMEKLLSLSQFLITHKEEIKISFVRDSNVLLLLDLQTRITTANEEELGDFFAFMMGLNYASTSAKQDGRLNEVNTDAYMALLETAKSRILLLRSSRKQQHANLIMGIDSLMV